MHSSRVKDTKGFYQCKRKFSEITFADIEPRPQKTPGRICRLRSGSGLESSAIWESSGIIM